MAHSVSSCVSEEAQDWPQRCWVVSACVQPLVAVDMRTVRLLRQKVSQAQLGTFH